MMRRERGGGDLWYQREIGGAPGWFIVGAGVLIAGLFVLVLVL